MNPADIEFNRNIYKNIREKFDNKLRKINSIKEITNNHLWSKKDEALIIEDISLKSVFDEILFKIKHEARDCVPFSIHEKIIRHYLNSEKDNQICPIIFMDGRNKRSPGKGKAVKYPDRIQTAGGQDKKLENNPTDKSLFPGDRLVHYEYLYGHSNDQSSNYFPTMQIYNLEITSERGEKGESLAKNVPFFNFYMPNECWTDLIMGVKKSATSR